MEQILDDIECIPGVSCVYYYNLDKGILSQKTKGGYSGDDLTTVGKTLAKVHACGSDAFTDINEITLCYSEMNLSVHQVKSKNYLVIMYDKTLNLNLLNMTLAQTINDLRATGFGGDKVNSRPEAVASQPSPELPEEASGENRKQIEDRLNPDHVSGFLSDIEKALNKVIGPMASIIFNDAVQSWGNSSEPTPESVDALIKLIYNEIDDPEKINAYKVLIDPFRRQLLGI